MDAANASFFLEQTRSFLLIVQEVLEKKHTKVQGLLDKVKLTLSKPPSEGNLDHATVMLQRVDICTKEIERLQAMEIKLLKDEIRFMEMLVSN
jgi:hypothetical protein